MFSCLFARDDKDVHNVAVALRSVSSTYSVRMTRGVYVVSTQDAERILRAIEAHEPHVLVDADPLGDGLACVPVRLVTAHVMSVAQNVPVRDIAPAGSRRSLQAVH